MGFLCELLGFGTKKTTQERQLVPARDPPEFKSGVLADTGILWFFRKLLIPRNVAADYTKELGPPVRRSRKDERRAKRVKCKSQAKVTKKEEPKLVDLDACKEFRESVKAAPVEMKAEKATPVELKAESFDAKNDKSAKCDNKPTTITIHCDQCHTCTRIVDCTGHKNSENTKNKK